MNTATPSDPEDTSLDAVEHDEDEREQKQVDVSLEDEGLLPLPKATPADGPAPGA